LLKCIWKLITYSECASVALGIVQSACVLLYCHLWLVCLYHIFPHHLSTAWFLEKYHWRETVCFDFSTTLVCNIFHSKRISARYSYKSTRLFIKSIYYTCRILINSEFSRQIFERNTQMSNFVTMSQVGVEFFHENWCMDTHDEADSRF
jgi:hypothetical protein